jgi:hypothetical protein
VQTARSSLTFLLYFQPEGRRIRLSKHGERIPLKEVPLQEGGLRNHAAMSGRSSVVSLASLAMTLKSELLECSVSGVQFSADPTSSDAPLLLKCGHTFARKTVAQVQPPLFCVAGHTTH